MGWASGYIQKLQAGETVSFRPRGNSMTPKIESGQLCTVVPAGKGQVMLQKGDIVLCRVRSSEYLHLIHATKAHGDSRTFLIGNNKGHENGWIPESQIFGKLVKVEP